MDVNRIGMDCSKDNLGSLREALRGVPGEESTSPCGCDWKRVSNFRSGGVVLSGDILIRRCPWHAWYATLPIAQQKILSKQQRQNLKS